MKFKMLTLVLILFIIVSCVSKPPSDINNICRIFKQYPKWYTDSKDVEQRWQVPIPVQMAIIHQESKFDSKASPLGQKLLWVIPGRDLLQPMDIPKLFAKPGRI